ncbi:MAG: DUF2569 family protein [Anaerolineales bacterium]|nr:DUF2569 family protein [Anaerolineales bacterium]
MNEIQDMPDAEPKYKNIGGWLILVGIGLVITPFIRALIIYNDLLPAFSNDIWSVLTTPGMAAYHPLWAPLLIFELLGNVLFGLATIILLVYFIRKMRSFPQLYIIFLLAQMGFILVDFVLANQIPFVRQSGVGISARQIFEAFIWPLVWIRYFLVAERVKGTFVN